MATLAPSIVKESNADSLEKIAYNSVKTIPTREKNDQFRLGYSVWLFLSEKKGTLNKAVINSGVRALIQESDIVKIIIKELKISGIEIS